MKTAIVDRLEMSEADDEGRVINIYRRKASAGEL